MLDGVWGSMLCSGNTVLPLFITCNHSVQHCGTSAAAALFFDAFISGMENNIAQKLCDQLQRCWDSVSKGWKGLCRFVVFWPLIFLSYRAILIVSIQK